MLRGAAIRMSAIIAFAILGLTCPACWEDKDNCQDCSTWTACPVITKQCSWGAKTIQECSGGCCTTDPGKIDCNMAASYGWNGGYELYGDRVVVKLYGGGRYARIEIDASENGWILTGMTDEETEAVIHYKMTELRDKGQL